MHHTKLSVEQNIIIDLMSIKTKLKKATTTQEIAEQWQTQEESRLP